MARPSNPDAGADNVSALRRGFEVLDCIAAAHRPLGNAEIARQTGIPRPTVTRLVTTLVALGHVRPALDGERYELAAGVVRLAEAYYGGLDIRGAARPHLIALAESTGASSLLGVRDGVEMLVIEAARSRSAIVQLAADIGTRMALATSALGRAWLAGVDAATRRAVVAQLRAAPVGDREGPGGASALGVASVQGVASAHADAVPGPDFDALIDEARAAGCALSLGEWHPGINAVAVPVRTPAGEVVVINCGGASFLMSAERLRTVALPAVIRAAEALARDIGGCAGAALSGELRTPQRGRRRAHDHDLQSLAGPDPA